MHSKPEILKRREIARTRIFKVEECQLRFSNGNQRVFERMCRGNFGAVMIVPLISSSEILMIREYAAGIDDYHWSLPKGAVDPGETIQEGANRELKEEVGYGARELTFLKSFATSPGYMQHGIDVIVAEGLYEKKIPGDEPEEIEVGVFSLDSLSEWIMREDVIEGRAIAAIYMVRDWLQSRQRNQ